MELVPLRKIWWWGESTRGCFWQLSPNINLGWPWESYLNSLSLSMLLCKMGIIMLASQAYHKDLRGNGDKVPSTLYSLKKYFFP